MGVKALRVHWSRSAEESFDRLLRYIEAENPTAARQLFQRVREAVSRAAEFPEMAPYVPELGRTFREVLSVRPFRLVYQLEGDVLRIVTVLRQEQDFDPGRFLEE